MFKALLIGTVAALAAGSAGAVELITNGSFNSVTAANTSNALILADGTANLGNNATYITGWTVVDHSFGPTANHQAQAWYYGNGAADVVRNDPGWYSGWAIYGPANGAANGFTASPNGGALVAIDGGGDYRASLDQTLTGLTTGATYNVSFQWAGAQQSCCTGSTTEQVSVSFGGTTKLTEVYTNPQAGFSGWFTQNFSFVADGSTQLLSFLAIGTPYGQPPIVLLDGVSVQVAAVPEAATWTMLIAGFGLVGVAARRRRTGLVAA